VKRLSPEKESLKDIPLDVRAEMALKEAVPNTKDGDTLLPYGATAK